MTERATTGAGTGKGSVESTGVPRWRRVVAVQWRPGGDRAGRCVRSGPTRFIRVISPGSETRHHTHRHRGGSSLRLSCHTGCTRISTGIPGCSRLRHLVRGAYVQIVARPININRNRNIRDTVVFVHDELRQFGRGGHPDGLQLKPPLSNPGAELTTGVSSIQAKRMVVTAVMPMVNTRKRKNSRGDQAPHRPGVPRLEEAETEPFRMTSRLIVTMGVRVSLPPRPAYSRRRPRTRGRPAPTNRIRYRSLTA